MDNKQIIINFLEEMSGQDNKSTAFPYYYTIKDYGNFQGFFLTKTEAEEHLERNAYNYSKKAIVCTKCAKPAPKLEQFLTALFEHFDVPTPPKKYYEKKDAEAVNG